MWWGSGRGCIWICEVLLRHNLHLVISSGENISGQSVLWHATLSAILCIQPSVVSPAGRAPRYVLLILLETLKR